MIAGTLLGLFGRVGSLVGNMMVTYLIDDYCDTLIIIVAVQLLGKINFCLRPALKYYNLFSYSKINKKIYLFTKKLINKSIYLLKN